MNKLIYLLILSLSFRNLYSQSLLIKIKENDSLKPISFASIISNNKLHYSDINGELILQIAESNKLDTITVKYLGYETQKLVVSRDNKELIVKLNKKISALKEINIKGYTPAQLAQIIIKCIKLSKQNNINCVAKIITTSTKNNEIPIEFLKAYYSVNFEKNKLSSLTTKFGHILFPNRNDDGTFLSIGTTRLLLKSNPYSSVSGFNSPFILKNEKQLLSNYNLTSSNLGNNFLKVILKSKTSDLVSYIVLNLSALKIEELGSEWQFTKDYPIVSINDRHNLTDTLKISTTLLYENNRFVAQNLTLSYKYNDYLVFTNTILNFTENINFISPTNSDDFENDYTNIISKPIYDDSVVNCYFFKNDTIGIINEMFLNGLENNEIISSFDKSNDLVEIFTDFSFYSSNWNINWHKIRQNNSTRNSNTLKTFIYEDFICLDNKPYYNIKPVLDYSQSYFNYERTPTAEHYLKNFFYLTKIYSDSLSNELLRKEYSCPTEQQFKVICQFYNNLLENALWKYKFETNAGENKESLRKWDEFILSKLEL